MVPSEKMAQECKNFLDRDSIFPDSEKEEGCQ